MKVIFLEQKKIFYLTFDCCTNKQKKNFVGYNPHSIVSIYFSSIYKESKLLISADFTRFNLRAYDDQSLSFHFNNTRSDNPIETKQKRKHGIKIYILFQIV